MIDLLRCSAKVCIGMNVNTSKTAFLRLPPALACVEFLWRILPLRRIGRATLTTVLFTYMYVHGIWVRENVLKKIIV